MPEEEETPSTVVHAGPDIVLSEPSPDAARLSGASTRAQKGAQLCLASDVPATLQNSVKMRVSGRRPERALGGKLGRGQRGS